MILFSFFISGSRPGSAASDNSVGHDGKKFMKKKGGDKTNVTPEAGRKSPARPVSAERPRSKSPGISVTYFFSYIIYYYFNVLLIKLNV